MMRKCRDKYEVPFLKSHMSFYSSGLSWKIVHDEGKRFRIEAKPCSLFFYWILGGFLATLGITCSFFFQTLLGGILFGTFFVIFNVTGVVCVYFWEKKEVKGGPYLIWNWDEGGVVLPRTDQMFRVDEVIGFHELYGTDESGEMCADLELLVFSKDEKPERYLVISCGFFRQLENVSKPLAKEVQLPVWLTRKDWRGRKPDVTKLVAWSPVKSEVKDILL